MCSTPQKQPAATVNFCAPSGMLMDPPSATPTRVLEENGRNRRDMNVGIVAAMRRMNKEYESS
jgi:hypothetical protein